MVTHHARQSVLARLDRSGGREACWPWLGAVNSRGHGAVKIDGRFVLVHRFMFEVYHGRRIKPRHDVHHLCETKPCGNPTHLLEYPAIPHRRWNLRHLEPAIEAERDFFRLRHPGLTETKD